MCLIGLHLVGRLAHCAAGSPHSSAETSSPEATHHAQLRLADLPAPPPLHTYRKRHLLGYLR